MLPGRVRKSSKVIGCDRVGRSLIGERSRKLFGRDSVNPTGYMSGHNSGSDSGKILGNMLGYYSGK
jgi:hypothetical protein